MVEAIFTSFFLRHWIRTCQVYRKVNNAFISYVVIKLLVCSIIGLIVTTFSNKPYYLLMALRVVESEYNWYASNAVIFYTITVSK